MQTGNARLQGIALAAAATAACLSGGTAAAELPVSDGLVLWLSADRLEASPGEAVGAWPDRSRANHDATQPDPARRPTLTADAVNGRPALTFDGRSEAQGGDVLTVPFVPRQELTALVVFRRGTQSSDGSLHRPLLGSGTLGRYAKQRGVALTVDREPSRNRVRVEIGDSPSSFDYGVADDAFHVAALVVRRDAEGHHARLNLDGVDLPETTSRVPAGFDRLTIGGGDDATRRAGEDNPRFFAGQIAEVVVFDRALSAGELLAVGAFLDEKYGLGHAAWRRPAPDAEPVFRVAEGLFDQDALPTLGLPTVASQTFTVFAPSGDQPKFNHQVKAYDFEGHLYLHWQAAARDEDAADSHVLYSRSADGVNWSPAQQMAPPVEGKHIRSSGGWWSHGGELTCFFTFPSKPGVGRVTEMRTSPDGVTWSPIENAIRDASLVGNPTRLDDGALVGVFLFNDRQKRMAGTKVMTTDDPTGRSGWTPAEFPWAVTNRRRSARGVEPAIFKRPGGELVMVLRDMHNSFRSLASLSRDGGRTWTVPTPTDMPDSGSMQSAGNLPDGTAYLINVPARHSDTRVPLAITLSDDGRTFDRAWVVRADTPEVRFAGKEKFSGFSYPHSWVWNDHLYLVYATGKETVEVTRVHLDDLRCAPAPR
jgi:hypothetical protein